MEIRRAKREENLAKRRGITGKDGNVQVGGPGAGLGASPDSDDEGVNLESQVRRLLLLYSVSAVGIFCDITLPCSASGMISYLLCGLPLLAVELGVRRGCFDQLLINDCCFGLLDSFSILFFCQTYYGSVVLIRCSSNSSMKSSLRWSKGSSRTRSRPRSKQRPSSGSCSPKNAILPSRRLLRPALLAALLNSYARRTRSSNSKRPGLLPTLRRAPQSKQRLSLRPVPSQSSSSF